MKFEIILFYLFFIIYKVYTFKNVIVIMTDDQDLVLESLSVMNYTKKHILNQGVFFKNSYVSTPICCPSRSSFLTGKYMHKTKVFNNSIAGGCSSKYWQNIHEPYTVNNILHQNNFATFYAGKYLNEYGYKKSGGPEHVPHGWDWWIGLVGNSRYYNYTLSINGTSKYYENVYLTDLLANYSLEFLSSNIIKQKPFFMFLSPPAPHAPFIPADRHKTKLEDVKAVITPSFNYSQNNLKDKHWLLRMNPIPLPQESKVKLDIVQKNRLQTLLAVDEMINKIIIKLTEIKQINSTYIIFTSDNGYHIGQFCQMWDKRQPYETDVKVPLIIRGPKILSNSTESYPIVNIDLTPTIFELAGVNYIDKSIDGISFYNKIISKKGNKRYNRIFFIEYEGEGNLNSVSKNCSYSAVDLSQCSEDFLCKCQDSKNNSYICIRHISYEQNTKYCTFFDNENFIEFYNLNDDPFELKNLNYSTKFPKN